MRKLYVAVLFTILLASLSQPYNAKPEWLKKGFYAEYDLDGSMYVSGYGTVGLDGYYKWEVKSISGDIATIHTTIYMTSEVGQSDKEEGESEVDVNTRIIQGTDEKFDGWIETDVNIGDIVATPEVEEGITINLTVVDLDCEVTVKYEKLGKRTAIKANGTTTYYSVDFGGTVTATVNEYFDKEYGLLLMIEFYLYFPGGNAYIEFVLSDTNLFAEETTTTTTGLSEILPYLAVGVGVVVVIVIVMLMLRRKG